MPIGAITLLIVAILIYFGLLHRVLDRMRLNDRTALFILFLMIVGSFFSLTIVRQPPLTLNLGGAVIPIGVAIYLIATADTTREKWRGARAAVITGAAIFAAIKILNPEEQTMLIEPTYFFALIAGVVGYLSGRSRRSAFIGGTMGVVVADMAHYVELNVRGIRGTTALGGAGVFDAVVIAGLLAVFLAEIVGETREYMARGPLGGGRGDGRRGGPKPTDDDEDQSGAFPAAFGLIDDSPTPGRDDSTRVEIGTTGKPPETLSAQDGKRPGGGLERGRGRSGTGRARAGRRGGRRDGNHAGADRKGGDRNENE